MDPRLPALLFASTLAFAAACAGSAAGDATTAAIEGRHTETFDTAAISGFWTTVDRTWQRRDPDAFLELFSHDASFALVDRGVWLEGQDEIHAHFTSQFATQRPELRHVTELGEMRMIAPRTVALDGIVRVLDGPGDDTPRTVLRTLAITAIMARTDRDWRIVILRAHTLPS